MQEAAAYCSDEQEVATAEDALAGAQDILAERMSDDPNIRKRLRVVAFAQGSGKIKQRIQKRIRFMPNIMNLARQLKKLLVIGCLRLIVGEREGFLKVSIELEKEKGLQILFLFFSKRKFCFHPIRASSSRRFRFPTHFPLH